MKLTAQKILGACAVAWAAAATGAPLEAGLGINGNLRVGGKGAQMALSIHHEGWNGTSTGVRSDFAFPDKATGTAQFELFHEKDRCGHGNATLLPTADGRAVYIATATSEVDLNPEATVLSLTLPCGTWVGGSWTDASGKKREFPAEFKDAKMCLYSATAQTISFAAAGDAEPFTLTFPRPVPLMIQDDRKWVQTFTLRIWTDAGRAFRKGDQRTFTCILSAPDGVNVTVDQPVVVKQGPDWIPLDYGKNIEAGSALDFSGMGLQDAPAGKYGWLKNAGGHFEFEGRPGVHQRFYGVNLCFSASFPDQALADELVTRLVRLGYNTVRIHHYENWDGVVKGSKDRLTFNEEWTKRLDYLLFRAMEKGIYVTTDLFTTRPVMWRDVGIDRDGQVPQQVYKNLIGVHAPAFENWKTFSRNLLTHVNPYTGRAYKDEPGLPLISLINEGHLTWCWDAIKKEAPMKAAWKKWLAAKRAADPAFAKDVSDDAEKVPAWNNAALIAFMADVEDDLSRRQREFLRALGVKALLTSQNCGGHYTPLMAMREARYDYVDDHFYVDHPQFIARSWSLPSRCPNTNPVFSKLLPPVACAYTRMPSKPFCITEWNFSGPGMFRGVGGIMTGAMGALQDWDGLWRFAYSHSDDNLRDRRGVPGYFDVGSDPLGQASDRASVCLFLRGDMAPLADKLALTVTPDTFMPADGKPTGVVPKWRDAAWQTQVGTAVAPASAGVKTFKLGEQLDREKAPVPLAPNAALAFDRTVGSFKIDTPRTAGGFTPKGALAAGPVAFDVGDVPATVWASSLDGRPIAQSSRILVTHLTDVQANGNVYADKAKTTLLKWGAYPPVVQNGSAAVTLTLANPGAYEVWGLATTGKRLEKIPAAVRDGKLAFTATVKAASGARMLYEIVKTGL
ncbi:MAG: hypothetical protein IJJ84_15915 [Kiritimatiellae bacterium]|nr:hypothetical protein [Kiritimatiellia bacterium]